MIVNTLPALVVDAHSEEIWFKLADAAFLRIVDADRQQDCLNHAEQLKLHTKNTTVVRRSTASLPILCPDVIVFVRKMTVNAGAIANADVEPTSSCWLLPDVTKAAEVDANISAISATFTTNTSHTSRDAAAIVDRLHMLAHKICCDDGECWDPSKNDATYPF
jgi:hypothetical protein